MALLQGQAVSVFNPGLGGEVTDGTLAIEGPHYPKPHTWCARVKAQAGLVIEVEGTTKTQKKIMATFSNSPEPQDCEHCGQLLTADNRGPDEAGPICDDCFVKELDACPPTIIARFPVD